MIILKNSDTVVHIWSGQLLYPSTQINVEEHYRLRLLYDDDFLQDLEDGKAVINDGEADLSAAVGRLYLENKLIEFDDNYDVQPKASINIVPRADGDSSLGTLLKRWLYGFFKRLNISEYFDFTNSSNPSHSEGRVFYDQDEHALAVYNEKSDVTHQLGQEFLIRVHNDTGDDILNGSVVKISGVAAGSYFPTIELAQANTTNNASGTIGIVTTNISNGGYGYVTLQGKVHNINTSGMNVGNRVYLSDTIAGGITNIRPDIVLCVGYVLNVDETDGAILVVMSDLVPMKVFTGITYAEDDTESTTTSTDFQQKLRLSFTPSITGDYIIQWAAEIATNSNNKGCEIKIEQDDTTELNLSLNAPIVAGAWMTTGGLKKIIFSDTNTHTFDVDFRAETASTTAKIRRVRIMIRKV